MAYTVSISPTYSKTACNSPKINITSNLREYRGKNLFPCAEALCICKAKPCQITWKKESRIFRLLKNDLSTPQYGQQVKFLRPLYFDLIKKVAGMRRHIGQ